MVLPKKVHRTVLDEYGMRKTIKLNSLYQYRGRFPVVAKTIAERLGVYDAAGLRDYKIHCMFTGSGGELEPKTCC